jgi:hypothetical protein
MGQCSYNYAVRIAALAYFEHLKLSTITAAKYAVFVSNTFAAMYAFVPSRVMDDLVREIESLRQLGRLGAVQNEPPAVSVISRRADDAATGKVTGR